MKTLIAPLLALLLTASAAAQAPLRPENFAYRQTIDVSGRGPFHQLTLPLAVYQGVNSADLADLRVFNGQGEVLQYALLRSDGQAESQRTETAAQFFPLRVPGKPEQGAIDVSVTVRQGGDGTLVSVHQSAAGQKSSDLVLGAVVDASRLPGSIRSLRLLTADNKTPFHRYAIETSPDLQRWRVLKHDAQLVHLEHAGHRIDSDTVEWEASADRYLRLIWADPQRAPEIRSVVLGTVETSFRQASRIWSGEMSPAAGQSHVYDYTWPGQMPVDQLRINLPQLNTLAPLFIQCRTVGLSRHRHREEVRWESLANTVAYRLASPDGEIRSADISLPAGVRNHLRLVPASPGAGIGSVPPTVQIGFVPHNLVFLARGDGPFVLAWGASGLARSDLPVATLMPGQRNTGSVDAAPASLGPPNTGPGSAAIALKVAPENPSAQGKWLLWAVLLGGLLVLGSMARSLLGQLRQKPDTKR